VALKLQKWRFKSKESKNNQINQYLFSLLSR